MVHKGRRIGCIMEPTQAARGRMPTKDDIPENEKNEWGFPLASLWKFVGFVKGAGRYQPIEQDDE